MKILDVGCGFAPHGNVNIDIQRKRIPNFVLADAHFLPFKDQSFDWIYSSHVIEHLGNPLLALQDWHRVAANVMIKTPSAYNFSENPQHIISWNRFTFKHLLQRVFKYVHVQQTLSPLTIRGRFTIYFPYFSTLLTKLGWRSELIAIVGNENF